jgi:hypothetical protein
MSTPQGKGREVSCQCLARVETLKKNARPVDVLFSSVHPAGGAPPRAGEEEEEEASAGSPSAAASASASPSEDDGEPLCSEEEPA